MTNNSKIRESKQEWKLYSSFIGFVIAGGVMFYGIKQTTAGTGTSVDLILYSLVAEIIIVTFACLSIRCPECKLKWVWHAVFKKDANQWVPWLLSFEKCPQCASENEGKNVFNQEDAPDPKHVR
jgi:phage FluMu protein Com